MLTHSKVTVSFGICLCEVYVCKVWDYLVLLPQAPRLRVFLGVGDLYLVMSEGVGGPAADVQM